MDKAPCSLHKVAYVLIIVGALNWGAIGVGGFLGKNLNLVNMLLGSWPSVEWIVYILVGLSGLSMCAIAKCCGSCEMKK